MNQTELIDEIIRGGAGEFTGGTNIQKIACSQNKMDKGDNRERDFFHRFSNYQIPVGLPLNKLYRFHLEDIVSTDLQEKDETQNREQHLTYQMVDNGRFDSLFYSVGKDLGNSGLRKTKKLKR